MSLAFPRPIEKAIKMNWLLITEVSSDTDIPTPHEILTVLRSLNWWVHQNFGGDKQEFIEAILKRDRIKVLAYLMADNKEIFNRF